MGIFRTVYYRNRPQTRAPSGRSPAGSRWDLLDRTDRLAVARFAGGTRQVELCLSPISPLDASRDLGRFARSIGKYRSRPRHSSNGRLDDHPGASPCSRRKGGIQKNALGRSRGGFSTKIHLRTNVDGLPIGTALTAGEAHDIKGYEALMSESAPNPKVLLADRAYDADVVRADLEERGAVAVIPTKKNRRVQLEIDRAIYTLRNRIERCFNRLKNARRVATRYDKLAETFSAFVHLTATRLWLRHFVNRT